MVTALYEAYYYSDSYGWLTSTDTRTRRQKKGSRIQRERDEMDKCMIGRI